MAQGINGGTDRDEWDADGNPVQNGPVQNGPVEHEAYQAEPLVAAEHERLELGDEERLPWLESADDIDPEPEPNGRLAGFVALGALALAALIGGIYYVSHNNTPSAQADGSLIEASREPYKVAPGDPGGKTMEGTGDASFKVSEGKQPDGSVAAKAAAPAAPNMADAKAGDAAKPATAASGAASGAVPAPAAAGATGGVGVQVAAFSSRATAESGWAKLAAQYAPLKGLSHRVVEGQADIGTVYRLQAVAGTESAATALCNQLQSAGLKCQVKK